MLSEVKSVSFGEIALRTMHTLQRLTQSCTGFVRTEGRKVRVCSPIVSQDLDSNQIRRFGNSEPRSSRSTSVFELIRI